jgi:hypothetical protein
MKSHQASKARLMSLIFLYKLTIKGITMNYQLLNLLEEANIEKQTITDPVLFEITNQFEDKELLRASTIFLRGIGKGSQTPAKVIDKMWSMGSWYEENRMFTHKQRIWITGNLIEYWDQMDIEMRATLCL